MFGNNFFATRKYSWGALFTGFSIPVTLNDNQHQQVSDMIYVYIQSSH